jgi:hypothetical protein
MSIIERAKNILLKPNSEWEVIAKEPASVGGLMTGYAIPLGAIAAVIGIVAAVLFGAALASMFGGAAAAAAVPTAMAIVSGIVGFILSMLLVFGMCYVTSALAPSFGGQADAAQAGKLIVYSGTAVWVAGFLAIIPVLGGLLSLIGLGYACYLICIGVRPVLGVPQEKVATASVVILLVYFLGALIAGGINMVVNFAGMMGGAGLGL